MVTSMVAVWGVGVKKSCIAAGFVGCFLPFWKGIENKDTLDFGTTEKLENFFQCFMKSRNK
jgi:hypothetical protein